jgi:hypothetical protein
MRGRRAVRTAASIEPCHVDSIQKQADRSTQTSSRTLRTTNKLGGKKASTWAYQHFAVAEFCHRTRTEEQWAEAVQRTDRKKQKKREKAQGLETAHRCKQCRSITEVKANKSRLLPQKNRNKIANHRNNLTCRRKTCCRNERTIETDQ